jgi:hypothetical protein
MTPIDPSSVRNLLEAIVAAFSVLWGGMAGFSGTKAAEALREEQPPDVVAHRINLGIGYGYETFPVSIVGSTLFAAIQGRALRNLDHRN